MAFGTFRLKEQNSANQRILRWRSSSVLRPLASKSPIPNDLQVGPIARFTSLLEAKGSQKTSARSQVRNLDPNIHQRTVFIGDRPAYVLRRTTAIGSASCLVIPTGDELSICVQLNSFWSSWAAILSSCSACKGRPWCEIEQ